MSSDKASDIINTSFELLGHTGKTYVSNEDYIDFKSFEKIKKDEKRMLYV